jgi:hypothetical protein
MFRGQPSCKHPAMQAPCNASTLQCKHPAGSMNIAVQTFAVDFRQLPKVVFLLNFFPQPDWTFGNSQLFSFVKAKIQQKHHFWQLLKV